MAEFTYLFNQVLLIKVTALLFAYISASQSITLESLLADLESLHSTSTETGGTNHFHTFLSRSHDLPFPQTARLKRQVQPGSEGVLVLSDLETVGSLPVVPLLDFTVVTSGDSIYSVFLQADSSGSKNGASSVAMYNLQKSKMDWNPMEVYEVDQGIHMEAMETHDLKLVIVAGNEQCTIYEFSPTGALSFLQTLPTSQPSSLAVFDYLGKGYLAVSTPTEVKVYEWRGRHFNVIQQLPLREIASMDFFTLENSLFLATVSGINADEDDFLSCSVWKKNLDSKFFECLQQMTEKAALSVSYFKTDVQANVEEHFLSVVYQNEDPTIYKYDGEKFQPFQKFNRKRALEWMPVVGDQGEFSLFLSSWDDLTTYSYDGWRFHQEEMVLNAGVFGYGAKSMQIVQRNSDSLLFLLNRQNHTSSSTIVKLRYSERKDRNQELKRTICTMETWCSTRSENYPEPLELLSERLDMPSASTSIAFNGPATIRHANVTELIVEKGFGLLNAEYTEEVEKIAERALEVEKLLSDVNDVLEAITPGVTVITGPLSLKSLQLVCNEYVPCSFSEMTAGTLNGEPVEEFFKQTVNIHAGIETEAILEFEKLRVEQITTDYINNHRAQELISRDDGSIMRKPLTVNGSVVFQDRVMVGEDIDGVLLDREHSLIVDEDQTLAGKLFIATGSINNLTIKGLLNGADVSKTTEQKAPMKLENSWEHLSILDLQLKGVLLSNYTHDAMNSSFLTSGTVIEEEEDMTVDDMTVMDNKLSGIDMADFVRIDGGDYKVVGLKFLPTVSVDNIEVSGSLNGQALADLLALIGDLPNSATQERTVPSVKYVNCNNRAPVLEDAQFNAETMRDDVIELYGKIKVKSLWAHHLRVKGEIASVNWTEMINDAVMEGEQVTVSGQKNIEGRIELEELFVGGYINDLSAESNASESSDWVHDGDLVLNETLTVQRVVAGSLAPDTLLAEDEWSNDVTFEAGLDVGFINNINISRFTSQSVSIDESASLKTLNFIDGLTVERVNNTELFNGVAFERVVLLKKSGKPQEVEGSWLLDGGLIVAGNLSVKGLMNGMDVLGLCNMSVNNPKVIVAGSVITPLEPVVRKSVNYNEMDYLLSSLWFKDQPAVLNGNIEFHRVKTGEKIVVDGLMNGVNLTILPTGYLSKTVTRSMRAPLYIRNLTVVGTTRVDKIEGKVNGLKIDEFSKNVLQRGVDQRFTSTPTFQELIVPTLSGNFSFNGLNLSTDVLRYGTEKVAMLARKTVYSLTAKSVDVPRGVTIQNVDVSAWDREAVLLGRDSVYKGNLSLTTAEFEGPLSVNGMLGPIKFDSSHILTAYGAQKVTGKKVISGSLTASSLAVSGQANGINLDDFLENIGLKDENFTVKVPITLDNMESQSLEVGGLLGGANVSDMCRNVKNAAVITDLDSKFAEVMISAQKIHRKITNGAYFLDYYKMTQKLRGNVTAIAAFPVGSKSSLMVVHKRSTGDKLDWMSWNSRESKFKSTGDSVDLINMSGNISFIASGTALNRRFLFMEIGDLSSKLFLDDGQVLESSARNVTCAAPVYIPTSQVCLFLGQNATSDSLLCKNDSNKHFEKFQTFNTTRCIQLASVVAGNKTWLAVIGQKQSKSHQEIVFLTMYSFNISTSLFQPRQVLAVLNPVAVSAISYRRYHYLAVASPHQPDSVRSSVLSLFRYHTKADKWIRYQEIPLEAPLAVEFALLPSGQLALYALTANPTRVLVVYLFRGVAGFVEETAGFAISAGQRMTAFNVGGNHFVGISGHGYGQVIMAEFRGRRYG